MRFLGRVYVVGSCALTGLVLSVTAVTLLATSVFDAEWTRDVGSYLGDSMSRWGRAHGPLSVASRMGGGGQLFPGDGTAGVAAEGERTAGGTLFPEEAFVSRDLCRELSDGSEPAVVVAAGSASSEASGLELELLDGINALLSAYGRDPLEGPRQVKARSEEIRQLVSDLEREARQRAEGRRGLAGPFRAAGGTERANMLAVLDPDVAAGLLRGLSAYDQVDVLKRLELFHRRAFEEIVPRLELAPGARGAGVAGTRHEVADTRQGG